MHSPGRASRAVAQMLRWAAFKGTTTSLSSDSPTCTRHSGTPVKRSTLSEKP